ncbi:hypothetical protein [Legionella fairfieldensis]|uniref:hypothetical protein n=1 Tax=Legionella fairfieldensis TaxID=45064 RepID=UPI000AA5C405|nr:hypothetical protein [Legionella fairfieldensis]
MENNTYSIVLNVLFINWHLFVNIVRVELLVHGIEVNAAYYCCTHCAREEGHAEK